MQVLCSVITSLTKYRSERHENDSMTRISSQYAAKRDMTTKDPNAGNGRVTE